MKKVTVNYLALMIATAFVATGCNGLKKMADNANSIQRQIQPNPLEMHAGKIPVKITVAFPAKYFDKNAYLICTPSLSSATESKEVKLKNATLQGEKVKDNNPTISYKNGGQYVYVDTIDYEDAYKKSDLLLSFKATKNGESVDVTSFKIGVSITCIGEAQKGTAVYRSGAGQNDLICVSGNLGAAYMGLQLLEREKAVFNSTPHDANEPFNPDFAGKEYLLERQLKPEARGDIIKELREAGIQPTAMMDISDGLSSELIHICKQSGTGCSVYQERIPIDYQTAVMAEELNMDVYTCALNGGEDYELLFTVPLTDHDKIIQLKDVKLIGHMTKPELGRHLVTKSGQEVELKAQGWTSNL